MAGDSSNIGRANWRGVGALTLAVVLGLPQPGLAHAAPAGQSRANQSVMERVDAGFRAGQAQFNGGEFLAAARTWANTAKELPEESEHRDNRSAIYEYIADAYEKLLLNGANASVLREGLAVLEEYSESFIAAYPGQDLPARVTRVSVQLRAAIADAPPIASAPPPPTAATDFSSKAATEPSPPRQDVPASVASPWRGLAIGGGVALSGSAAMLGMAAFGMVRGSRLEEQADSPEYKCNPDMLDEQCSRFAREGKTANQIAVSGSVVAALLAGAGIAMLVVAMRRKSERRRAATPLLGPGMAGMTWWMRF